ncbi:hypothetical protein [Lysinibacillus sp. RC79]|uniref:hypothetical protein n=1 Tax=Lysinibacillus sp. RC79 TaxID=3156296 RepID=UPI003517AB64
MKPKVLNTIDTRSELKKAVDAMKADLGAWLEHAQITAQITSSQYKILIKEGFTEQQAMEIITTQPSWRV